MAEVKMKLGKKVDKAKVDKAKLGKGKKPEQREGAEGQSWEVRWISCPYCWAVNDVWYDTSDHHWYECWNCHEYFDA